MQLCPLLWHAFHVVAVAPVAPVAAVAAVAEILLLSLNLKTVQTSKNDPPAGLFFRAPLVHSQHHTSYSAGRHKGQHGDYRTNVTPPQHVAFFAQEARRIAAV